MPRLDDLTILASASTVAGNDLIPLADVSATTPTQVRKLPVYGLLGLQSTDVATQGDATTVSTRLVVVTGTTPTVTLPAAAGSLRQVIIMNTASGAATIEGAGSENILTGTANALNISVATGKSAILLSDGTRWYHISNDA